MLTVDLNCDMGEGFGNYTIGNDQAIIPYVSSVNIACGFHAGDPSTMNKTVKQAIAHNVKIGAHPGLPDLNGFGRRMIDISPDEAYELTIYQVGALQGFVRSNRGNLHHVKAHGALYNMACKKESIASAIANAVADLDKTLILVGLSKSKLIDAGKAVGLQVAEEVFADRTYQADGTLTPRSENGAVINDEKQAINQVIQMITEGSVTAIDGSRIAIQADTICVHGDSPHALTFVKQLRQAFDRYSITLG
ncbi:5-oxoprolinase subunit PxpA [Aquibacillus kalidii]|uniref:5-oxoprolinase subunit PxpA n=1 Tax=Aquibacillus kalidii TaxID=2762597 RepID=UPI001647CABF|nr:5-oxoprolinase subunit PxpA [Aquibacillus kalidii]